MLTIVDDSLFGCWQLAQRFCQQGAAHLSRCNVHRTPAVQGVVYHRLGDRFDLHPESDGGLKHFSMSARLSQVEIPLYKDPSPGSISCLTEYQLVAQLCLSEEANNGLYLVLYDLTLSSWNCA